MVKRRANGEGTLRRRADGRWESSIMIGWKDDGRRQMKSFYGKTREEVRKKVLEWKKTHTGNAVCKKDYSFEEWADMWFEIHKGNISPTTQEGYRYTLVYLDRGGSNHISGAQLFLDRFTMMQLIRNEFLRKE